MEKKKGFIAEFKEFIMRGNVMDMAVGIVIGSAFVAIVNALVEHIINPLISLATGGTDLSSLGADLGNGNILGWGAFVQSIISFVLIALVVFLLIKGINSMRRKKEEEPEPEAPAGSTAEELLADIKGILEKQAEK